MFWLTQKHKPQQSSKNPKPEKTEGKKEEGDLYQIEGGKRELFLFSANSCETILRNKV